MSFAMLGVKIKQLRNQEWTHKLAKHSNNPRHHSNRYSYRAYFKWSTPSKLRVPMGTPRETASAFY
ncbi:hypothetical protein DL98DRAFT_621912 [Cadophora sp. DSE1049]|nr:hypothetical protein DL98DRAFT_621912 [Cadophora sp. DSE1049]